MHHTHTIISEKLKEKDRLNSLCDVKGMCHVHVYVSEVCVYVYDASRETDI